MIPVSLSAAPSDHQDPPCTSTPPSTSDTGPFEHVWAGLVYTAFTLDGDQVWTGEDGGRIRHRHPSSGVWSFQQVPFEVRGTIRDFHFQANQQDGWAVSSDGWVLHTDDGGATWVNLARLSGSFGLSAHQDLHKIWMHDDGDNGILLGLHGIWYTEDGGVCWTRADMYEPGDPDPELTNQESFFTDGYPGRLYGLDVRVGAADVFLAFVVGTPGVVLRSVDWGETWFRTLEVRIDGLDTQSLGGSLACLHPIGSAGYAFWDVAISHNETEPLVLVVGGKTNGCGLILASDDAGVDWAFEEHECDNDHDCTTDPDYNPDTSDPPTDLNYRHQDFSELYGVTIYHDSNVALAVGYGGQHLWRELTGDPQEPVWRDRSEFGHISHAPYDVVMAPLTCVTVAQGTDKAWLSGFVGHVRRSLDRGDSWADERVGEPFRTQAVFFKEEPDEDDRGWSVGQGYRIAWSEDGGESWVEKDPLPPWPPNGPACRLDDIAFTANLEKGVTVGCSTGQLTGPRILYTESFATEEWKEPSLITWVFNEPFYHANGHLRRVAWGGDSNDKQFWAAGKNALVLETANGGKNWTQREIPLVNPPDPPDAPDFDIWGVAAAGGTHAVFVGRRAGVGTAWLYDSGGPSWTNVSPPSGEDLSILTDVTIDDGGRILAVGQRELGGGAAEGVVLEYDDVTERFEVIPGPFDPDGTPECFDAGVGMLNQGVRTLTAIAVDPAGNLWIAGVCGQVWELPDSSSTWVEHKSRTGVDITRIQFVNADRGYFTGHSNNQIHQVLVRIDR